MSSIGSWPAGLPFPIVEFSGQCISGQSEEDGLYNKRTRGFPGRAYSFSFYLSDDEFVAWRTFFDDTVHRVGLFTAEWLSIIGLENHYAKLEDGSYEARRIDDDHLGYWHKNWSMSAKFEIIQVA